MKNKLVKTRKFVNDHRTYLAFCAGSIATSAVITYLNKDLTMLHLSKENLQTLKSGTAFVYELKDQTLTLVNIPAHEAALAAL